METRVFCGALLGALVMGGGAVAEAQSCVDALRALTDVHQRMRVEVLAHQAATAVSIWEQHQLETPAGYRFEQNVPCQSWAREVGNDHRFGCSLERAQVAFEDVQRQQTVGSSEIDVRAALAQVTRRASVSFSCPGQDNLFLICRSNFESVPDAWCARRVSDGTTLEFPLDATCKVVDGDGADVMKVVPGAALTCSAAEKAHTDADARRARAERRASVAAMGTFTAFMAAVAVPATFVPVGIARFFGRVGVLDDDNVERMRHRAYRARVRYSPLIGMTALSVSSLSSRFWWAGVLTASCGITADVMLIDYWRNGSSTKRAIGIATASVAAAAGLVLDLETLAFSDVGAWQAAVVPTLRLSVAQLELGLSGRF